MLLRFTKMSGAGNDFIMVDDRRGRLRNLAALARRLCPRGTAVGADGLIALAQSRSADVRMRYLNADGSEVEMCGNGARCTALFARRLGAAAKRMVIETPAGPHRATVSGTKVSIEMPPPHSLQLGVKLRLKSGQAIVLHGVNTGVPHAVRFVADVDRVKVVELGREIRYHRRFRPAGSNANFVRLGAGTANIRTYERGVEDETLACGTGACAAAVVATVLGKARGKLRLRTRSGEVLSVKLLGRAPDWTGMVLTGPVSVVYEGKVKV